MSDLADHAQVWEERHRDAALKLQRERAAEPAGASDGRCETCDEAIPPARLRALPTARLCVHCQSIADQRRRTLYGGA